MCSLWKIQNNNQTSISKKPRFSQIFNFEDDFKVVLEKEEQKKALEMFSQKRLRLSPLFLLLYFPFFLILCFCISSHPYRTAACL